MHSTPRPERNRKKGSLCSNKVRSALIMQGTDRKSQQDSSKRKGRTLAPQRHLGDTPNLNPFSPF